MDNSFNLFNSYCINSSEYSDFSEKELIELIKMGDFKAEKYLYARYLHIIKTIVGTFFILGGDKDDLFQEAMIGFLNAVNKYNPNLNKNFRSFAELCIRRQIISAIRKSKGYEKNLLNKSISIYECGNDEFDNNLLDKLEDFSCPDPENVFIVKEEMNTYYEIRSKILSRFESAVLTEYENEKTYEEISFTLDRDLKAIDNAMQRIKKKINQNKGKLFDMN